MKIYSTCKSPEIAPKGLFLQTKACINILNIHYQRFSFHSKNRFTFVLIEIILLGVGSRP